MLRYYATRSSRGTFTGAVHVKSAHASAATGRARGAV
jgi:hypothetical protein